jgi:phosphomannomutase/phosphoglucomutase
MILHDKIFRAYDIRGEAFVDFDEDGFMAIAHGFGQYLKTKHRVMEPKVLVSGDGRQSMPELYPAIISGLKASGCDVVWAGAIPTPMNYFGFHHGDFDAAIQISASHNPAGDNGLKLTDRDGAVSGDEIQKIKDLANCADCRMGEDPGECINGCQKLELETAYIQKIKSITPTQSGLKLVVDAGNAIPGMFYPNFLRSFGHEVKELFCDLNTTFPNHQPDPERVENLKFLRAEMDIGEYDLGLAFDGDGDRVGIVLADGTVLSADKIIYVLGCDFLSRNPGAAIVLDAMSSQLLITKLEAKGAKVILSQTGHSHIEHAMTEHKALLGGEQSGHFMFGENFYGHDDALLAVLRFIQALQTNPELEIEVTSGWDHMLEVSERLTVDDEQKFEILQKVIHDLKAMFPDASTLDGIRIDFGQEEWAIIRCSNTSPKIALRLEARNSDSLESKKKMLMEVLERYS